MYVHSYNAAICRFFWLRIYDNLGNGELSKQMELCATATQLQLHIVITLF